MEVHGFIDRIVVKFHIIRACQHYKTSIAYFINNID